MQPAGLISQLGRYWVKSMRGESLPAASLTLQGIEGDRSYAFVQAASRSSFPWLTARELPELLCYKAVATQDNADAAEITVVTPAGRTFPVESEDLRLELEARSGRPLYLLHDYRGSFDAAPVSLIARQTVARIAEESGTQEDPWRFRPSLLIDLQAGAPFDELNWVGRILRIGESARIAVT
ncbi:MAG: MOSC N-terminal beta barrel domain-containing protein, partial [Terriglobia bacterium]